MTKRYLVDEDQYSGQIVVICEAKEVEVDTYKPTRQELDAARYLYRDIPKQVEKKMQYNVRMYYHYEMGESGGTLLDSWKTFDKAEANEMFKAAVNYLK